jgi:hypothetical protein
VRIKSKEENEVTTTELEKRNRSIGLKTRYHYCEHCNMAWAFDHLAEADDKLVVHFPDRHFAPIVAPITAELCPTCEVAIMKTGAEVDYGSDD